MHVYLHISNYEWDAKGIIEQFLRAWREKVHRSLKDQQSYTYEGIQE